MFVKYLFAFVLLSANAAEELQEINVNAAKMETTLSDIPASIGVIHSEDIEDMQAQNIDELLALLPGVNAYESPRVSGQRIQIRGIDSSKIIVLIDGARQNFRNSHNSGLLVNQDLINKVEVMKGPSSSLYGSGAVGGLVSFETKSASDFLKKDEKVGAQLKLGYRTANDLGRQNLMVFGKQFDQEILASISNSFSNNIKTGSGERLEYSGSEEVSAFLKLSNATKSKHQYQLSYERVETEAEEPSNPSGSVSTENSLVNNMSQRDSANFKYKFNQKNKKWLDPTLTSYYSSTSIDKTVIESGSLETRNVKTVGIDFFNNTSLFKNSALPNYLTYGFEFVKDEHDGGEGSGELGTFPDGKARSLGVFIQDKVTLFNDLQIIPGLRYDSYKIESTDSTQPIHDDNETSAKLALSYEASQYLTLYSNYAEGFNAPRLQDLYVSGIHFPDYDGLGPATDNYFSSNPNLKAERTKTYEVGFKFALDSILSDEDAMFMEATAFKTKARDFIERKVDFTNNTTYFQNVSNADFEGFEAKLGYETEALLVQLNYAQVRSEDQDSNNPLNDTPADEWNLNLKYNFSEDIAFGYHGVYAERQDKVTTDGVRTKDLPYLVTPSYNIHNLFATWAPKDGQLENFEFLFKINNIFNKQYRKHTAPVNMPGRDVQTSIKYRF